MAQEKLRDFAVRDGWRADIDTVDVIEELFIIFKEGDFKLIRDGFGFGGAPFGGFFVYPHLHL